MGSTVTEYLKAILTGQFQALFSLLRDTQGLGQESARQDGSAPW